MPQRGRVSLTLVLVLGAFAEVLLHRIVMQLVDQQLLGFTGSAKVLRLAAELGGQFAFHFCGVLALAICTWAIYLMARDRELLALPWRISLTSTGAIVLSLSAIGLFFRLHSRAELALDLAFVALLVTIVLTASFHEGPLRHKFGLLYLAAILLLRSGWLLQQQLASLLQSPLDSGSWSVRLYSSSDQLIALSGVVVLLCYGPLARWKSLLRPVPLLLSLGVTALATGVVVFEYPLAELIAQRGFNLQLPHPGSLALALHVVAIFPFILTTSALLGSGAVGAGVAMGLLAIALSGYYLITSQQLLLTLVGLLQLTRASLAKPETARSGDSRHQALEGPSADQWKAFLERLATGCGDAHAPSEAVVLQDRREKIARVRSALAGIPYAVRLVMRDNRLAELEVDVGQPPKDEPAATLARRRDSRGQHIAAAGAPRIKSFDHRFVLRDRTGNLVDALGPLIEQLQHSIHGWLGIWPAEGLRYICRPMERSWPVPVGDIAQPDVEADVRPLQEVVRLLVEIAQKVEVRG